MQGVGHLLKKDFDFVLSPLLAGVDQEQPEDVCLQPVSQVHGVMRESAEESLVQVDPESLQGNKV